MGMSDQNRHPQNEITNPPPPVVELHIGELVLEGFPHLDQAELVAVVQQELTRLLAEGGLPAGLARVGEVASLDGGEFQVKQGSQAAEIGVQIAQAVYGGLAR
jgi:hypothetical protein